MKKIYCLLPFFFICFVSQAQLSGIKTIPGDYATIAAAITALNASGVGSGGVTFNVAAGHTETAANLIITATGTLANPIVFQKSGAGANPLITASPGVSGILDGVIILRGTDYITFNGIDVKDPATNVTSPTQMEWGYALLKSSGTNGCQYVMITNCTITLQRIYAGSIGIYSANHLPTSVTTLTVTSTSGANSFNRFYSNVIQNVKTGISLTGFNDVSPYTYYDQQNDVGGLFSYQGNTIQNFGGVAGIASYGINNICQNGHNISNNTINNLAGGGVVSAAAIYGILYSFSVNAPNGAISYNTINLSQGANASAVYCIYFGNSGTSSVTMGGNVLSASFSFGATGSLYCIYMSSAMSSINLNTNTFSNSTSLNTTGSVYFIWNSTTTPTVTVSGNTINNITKPLGGGGSFYGYYNNTGPTGGTETINSNSFTNINLYSTTPFYGIYSVNATVTQNKSIYSNTISGISGGSSNMYGIYCTNGNTVTVYGNVVNSMAGGAHGTGAGTLYGYYLGSASTVTLAVNNNQATNLSSANTGPTYGITIGGGTAIDVHANSVYNVSGSVAASILFGYYILTATEMSFYNNTVSNLTAPSSSVWSAINGIFVNNGTGIGMYYNTVYLDASSSATTFGTSGFYSSSTATVDFRNNNIVNVSTAGTTSGFTVAYRRSSTTLTTYSGLSNNNNFYAGTPSAVNLIFYDGTNTISSMSAYKSFVAPRDGQSVSENPPFTNVSTAPYDLHLKTTVATACESGGTVISSPLSIVMDYDNNVRYPNGGYPNNVSYPATAPDIGFDEFAGMPLDVNGPVITYTALSNTASTTSRMLTTTITDPGGVPISGIGLPVLYWKINSGTYTAVAGNPIGGNQYTFTFGAGVVVGDIVSYYIVAQDGCATPNVSGNPAIGASGYSANPPAVSTPTTSPSTYTILGSLCGTYNVGTGQTYATLTAAIADLNAKAITCPVVFQLMDATYGSETFPITINPNIGSSATNTVTIRPASGVTSTISGSSVSGIIILNGAKYIIIDGSNSGGSDKSLTIENTNTSANRYSIGFSNSGGTDPATNNTIKNCNIKASSQVTNSTYGIFMNSTGGGYDNTIINNNTIYSARTGIFFTGSASVPSFNGQITNNIIGSATDATSIQYEGIVLKYANGTLISGNEIMGAPAGNTNAYQVGIYINTGSVNTKIRKNRIHDWFYSGTLGYGCYGIWYNSDATTVTEISNNLIYLIKGDGWPMSTQTDSPYGIYISNGGNCQIWFNSIYMSGSVLSASYAGALSACLSINPGITGLDVRNNIFKNSMQATSGSPADYTYAIFSTSANTAFSNINNNNYWVDGIGPNIGYLGGNQATLSAWQTATAQDANSLNVDPLFVSTTDLHTYVSALGKTGVTIPAITDDFAGVPRTSPPDMGAYQFSSNPTVITTAATSVTCGSVTLNGTINPNYSVVTTGFDYGTSVSYGSSVAGTPASVSGSTVTTITATVTDMVPNVVNHYRLKGTTGGSTVYGSDMTVTPPCLPVVVTVAATSVTSSGATLNGTVNANNLFSTVSFEYGLTTAYGTIVTGVPSSIGGNLVTPASVPITGLTPGVTYHFRINAANAVGTANGNDMTFTTLPDPPAVVTLAATGITFTTATLNGTVNANGALTYVFFEYGLSTTYGSTVMAVPLNVTGNTVTSVIGNLTGLTCNTLYHYRIKGINPVGTSYGNDMTFTTDGAVAAAGTITGTTSVCRGAAGVTYTIATIPGATGYAWSVPTGATITSGANTTTITVTFGMAAISGNITVYGTNSCMNGSSSSLAVTVNLLPVPTITGPASACVNSSGNIYYTEPGMTGYTWTITPGGVITAGSGTNSITVTWNMAGAQSVSVNYTNSNGCLGYAATVKNITVNPLPVPTITGLASICAGATATYYTQTGMTGYTWTVSSGGTITSGAGTPVITVIWNTVGSQTVSVSYTNTNGCTAAVPAVKTVAVNAIPEPTITGAAFACAGSTGNVYTTESGMTGYTWTVSADGTITAGAGTNAISVTWPTAGARTVSVNYMNTDGCTAATATVKNVTINPLPVPTITGLTSVCAGTTGVSYTTEPGMTVYTWIISSGGTITAGTGTSAITVTWTTAGTQYIAVNYVNSNGCNASTTTSLTVIVNPLPVPYITGTASTCVGSTGSTYTTQPGMTNYGWTVSSGGLITAGNGTNSITVNWSTSGTKTVSVNYTNTNGCTAATPGTFTVTVNPLPVPTITGSILLCQGSAGVNYYTESGMTGYTWTISAGGTITAGNGTRMVTVTWNTAGAQTLSVTYTNANGCNPATPTVKNVMVNPVYTPTLTGTDTLCLSTQNYVYTTESGMNNYSWNVSSGGSIMAGGTTSSNTVTVRWNTAGMQYLRVNYANGYGCSSPTPTYLPVTVYPVNTPYFTGPNKVCAGTTGCVYTAYPGMTNYNWTVSSGGTITAGGTLTSNTVTVTWNTSGTQYVTLNYTNTYGCTAASPHTFYVVVNPLPAPTITGPATVCVGTAGNVYYTQTGMTNYTWTISSGGTITSGGTSVSPTVTVTWNTAGTQYVTVNYKNSNGCSAAIPGVKTVTVNPLPTPTITGPSSLCSGVAGTFYTQTGNSSYTWSVSTGGTITAGGSSGTPYISVKWTTTGAKWVRVNYTSPGGCRATTYTQFNTTVYALPTPTVTGPTSVCQGSTGNVYTTQAGMTGYTWTVSTGGTITAGAGTNSITVTWTGSGTKYVRVNYTNANGCSALYPANLYVTVTAAPVPILNGTFSVCANTTVVYYTESGKTNYNWTVSSGGMITSGQGTNIVNVVWTTPGTRTISVIYSTSGGCQPVNPTVKTVNVFTVPVPTITGPTTVCVGAYVTYTTEAGMSNYTWTLGGSGGIIYSGFYSRQIFVKWTTTGAKTVSVNYTAPGGCRAPTPTVLNVYVTTCADNIISGIESGQTPMNFTVYPNPNNGKFRAAIECECTEKNCSITVFNMMGLNVFELSNIYTDGKLEVPIDLQELPQGIYTVIFRNSNHWLIRKIVINK